MEVDFLYLGLGLAVMGYYIGNGLQWFNRSSKTEVYMEFLKEEELGMVSTLKAEVLKEMIEQHPDVPRTEINGVTYYPKQLFLNWLSSADTYKQKTKEPNLTKD